MAQDFAKKHSTVSAPATELPRWSWLIVGFLFGLFAAFLIYLWKFVPADTASNIATPTADVIKNNQKPELNTPDFDFYEIFPRTEVPVVEEYTPSGKKVIVEDNYSYVLQTGSFQSLDDADRRRAELILLGLQVSIKKVEQDGTVWHRVMVGPVDSKLELDRTRNRLAEANIESISMRLRQ